MPDEEVSVQSQSGDDGTSQKTLAGGSAEAVDADLEPYEEAVYEALKATLDGETIKNLDEHDPSPKEMLGVVELGEDPDGADIDDTIFDPEHMAWTFGPEDWVTTPAEADSEISGAIRKLTAEGIFKTSVTKRRGQEPLEMKVTVRDIE